MFKKLFAILLALMMLCSCQIEEPSEPVLPEEPVISETETETEAEEIDFDALRKLIEYPSELNSTPCDFEGGNPYKAADVEIPVEVEEALFGIAKLDEFDSVSRIESSDVLYAILTMLPMVNKYDLEPELAEKLAPLFETTGSDCIYPKEWVVKVAHDFFGTIIRPGDHRSIEEGFVYHEETGVYLTPNKGLETVYPYISSVSEYDLQYDGKIAYEVEFFYVRSGNLSSTTLGDEGYTVECDIENGENFFEKPEFIEFAESGKDIYTARIVFDGEKTEICWLLKNHQEPELIAEHIAALNMCAQEYFGAKNDGNTYFFYFKEENKDWKTVPDMISDEYFGETTEGYVWDYFERDAYLITNFKTKAEVKEYMGQWIAPAFFETDHNGIDHNFMEANGNLYLLRGNRGYGVISYGNSEIVSQSETEMVAVAKIYAMDWEDGTAEIKFEKIDGKWIIVSVEDNYY